MSDSDFEDSQCPGWLDLESSLAPTPFVSGFDRQLNTGRKREHPPFLCQPNPNSSPGYRG